MAGYMTLNTARVANSSVRKQQFSGERVRANFSVQKAPPQSKCSRVGVVAMAEGGGGGNPFGNMGALMESMKKAQQIAQSEGLKVQEELKNSTYDGYDSEELVRVVLKGNQEPQSCEITEEAMEKGAEALGLLITEAHRDAHTKSTQAMKERMADLASKMGFQPAR
ncbi:hypothetical protein CYMTET_42824 [Cymbomonas tetramitiformis]|uniref:Nucleoid-associated protein n=1 Tax=Cymbomonas tetramitiformis TaxID=36881 RepID=A0AAE0F0M2_9CHLO|nr:hypothetical protein CYMTET_42824 [Cymbomonas tetramitiformis]